MSKLFGINRLSRLRLAKIFIRGELRINDSGPKGYGWKRAPGAGGSGKIFIRSLLRVRYSFGAAYSVEKERFERAAEVYFRAVRAAPRWI